MINCVIVEDELSGQMLLKERLARLFPEVSIMGLFDQPKQAIDGLKVIGVNRLSQAIEAVRQV